MFRKVLIANRGVVAQRVARTARKLGVRCVFVYSEADAKLPYVCGGDEAYAIGAASARESYLNSSVLLEAARVSGCDAVHPGWGFLSEDPEFARAVERQGICFIGPDPSQIRRMGNKIEARQWAAEHGIPALRASGPLPQDGSDLDAHADSIGLPMLVKAAAGGGGIGMQRVDHASQLRDAATRTRQLAERAFGDSTIYLERYVNEARHIEFQMIGDGKGNVANLYERDCSIQRRNQKIVEECPAPRVDVDACARMGLDLAGVLARWNYRSLGTVETLMDQDGQFYFLEMNTRLQVEHAVTEEVTGLDLVEMQFKIAAGASLRDVLPAIPRRAGHAIELRVYAEDPVRFLPSSGMLSRFECPELPGVRVETPFAQDVRVSSYYDPLLALVIVRGTDRADALVRARQAIDNFHVEGIKTNIPFLQRLLTSDAFVDAQHSTASVQRLAASA